MFLAFEVASMDKKSTLSRLDQISDFQIFRFSEVVMIAKERANRCQPVTDRKPAFSGVCRTFSARMSGPL